jgi:hypothetical protein
MQSGNSSDSTCLLDENQIEWTRSRCLKHTGMKSAVHLFVRGYLICWIPAFAGMNCVKNKL